MVLSNAEKQARFRDKQRVYIKSLEDKIDFLTNKRGFFMLYVVFSIFDSATQVWGPPMFLRAKGDVLRQFIDAVNDPNTRLAQHPQDFALFELGTWDDVKCEFSLHVAPIRLGLASEFVKPKVGV